MSKKRVEHPKDFTDSEGDTDCDSPIVRKKIKEEMTNEPIKAPATTSTSTLAYSSSADKVNDHIAQLISTQRTTLEKLNSKIDDAKFKIERLKDEVDESRIQLRKLLKLQEGLDTENNQIAMVDKLVMDVSESLGADGDGDGDESGDIAKLVQQMRKGRDL